MTPEPPLPVKAVCCGRRKAAVLCTALVIGASAAHAANFTVTSTADSGTGSLRQAITDANSTAGADEIDFAITAGSGVRTITLSTAQPAITETVTIEGTTQSGFTTMPVIAINGNNRNLNGLTVSAGGCTIRGLIINKCGTSSSPTVPGHGIAITGPGSNKVELCRIGTDATGAVDNGNRGDGVNITNSPNNTIGGTDGTKRNVISGISGNSGNSGNGVTIGGAASTNNVVEGDYIGLGADGAVALGNSGNGVSIADAGGNTIGGTAPGAGCAIADNSANSIRITGASAGNTIHGDIVGLQANGSAKVVDASYFGSGIRIGSANTQIGGTTAAARNIISGSTTTGILFDGPGATGNSLEGNYIGTDITGTVKLGNANAGVSLDDDNTANGPDGPTGNRIGGSTAGARNVISGNGYGITIFGDSQKLTGSTAGNTVQGNFIGTDATGNAALGNFNDGVSIDFSPDNVIGGSEPGEGNVISGNGHMGVVNQGNGINLGGGQSTGTVIRGNFIGTDKTGTIPLGNANNGITIYDFFSGVPTGTLVGGTGPGDGNTIAFNLIDGIIYQAPTSIRHNLIYANGALNIDRLKNDNQGDPTPNGQGGFDGANYPVITGVTSDGATTTVSFTFHAGSSTAYAFDCYESLPSLPGPNAQIFLGDTIVTTNASGDASGSFTLGAGAAALMAAPFAGNARGPIAPRAGATPGNNFTMDASPVDFRIEGVSELTPAAKIQGGLLLPITGATNEWFVRVNDPINSRNGELYDVEAVDINLRGPMPLFFARYYASKLKTDAKVASALGDNRTHNFDWRLALPDGTHAEVITDHGRVVTFTKNNNVWTLTGRTDIAYQLAANGSGFVFGDPRSQGCSPSTRQASSRKSKTAAATRTC